MTDPKLFPIYQSEDGATRIDMMLEAETLWLNQKQLTVLFGFPEQLRQLFGFSEQFNLKITFQIAGT